MIFRLFFTTMALSTRMKHFQSDDVHLNPGALINLNLISKKIENYKKK